MANERDIIYFSKRSGTQVDPLVDITENLYVQYGKVFLKEIPAKSYKVTVQNTNNSYMTEVFTPSDLNTTNVFLVDYANGVVFFNGSNNGQQKKLVYKGEGVILFPASRIYTDSVDGSSQIQTLQETVGLAQNITPRGTYSGTVAYKKGNIVFHNDLSYMALRDVTGIAPPNATNWQAILRGGLQGAPGIPGERGEKGEKGEPGNSGSPMYTWIKYASTPTSGMSDSPDGKEYIGIAVNKTSPTKSIIFSEYTWSQMRGDRGAPGLPGTPGNSLYTWIKYADSPTTGMSDSPEGKLYIGIATNKPSSVKSVLYGDYSWFLFRGENGTNGLSAYEIAVSKGFVGTEQQWVDSLSKGSATSMERETVMENFCLFYGFPISINGTWTVEEAAKVYAKYDGVVWGDGYQKPTNEVYSYTVGIARRVKELNPKTKIFGYVPIGMDANWADSSLPISEIKARVDAWYAIGATHIFLDEFGFDYGVSRERQNAAVDHCHSKGMGVIANGWIIDHMFSNDAIVIPEVVDANGNPFQANPNRLPASLGKDDFVLFESFMWSYDHPPGGGSTSSPPQLVRSNKRLLDAIRYMQEPQAEFNGKSFYEQHGTKGIALDAIIKKDEKMYQEGFYAALAVGLHGYSASVAFWGASTSTYHAYDKPITHMMNRSQMAKAVVEEYDRHPTARITREIGGNRIEITWSQRKETMLYERPPEEGAHHIVALTIEGDAIADGGVELTFGNVSNPDRIYWIPLPSNRTAAQVRQIIMNFDYGESFKRNWKIYEVGNKVYFETRENLGLTGNEWWVWHLPGFFTKPAVGLEIIQQGVGAAEEESIRQIKVGGTVIGSQVTEADKERWNSRAIDGGKF